MAGKFFNRILENKRGKKYTSRDNAIANGLMKHYGNQSTKMTDDMRRLAVYGTFDQLARQRFDRIWITVMHPIDHSYTKRVMILLKNKKNFMHRIQPTERNKNIYKKI